MMLKWLIGRFGWHRMLIAVYGIQTVIIVGAVWAMARAGH